MLARLVACCVCLAAARSFAGTPPELASLLLSPECPVISDNDWLLDTPDDEYLLAKWTRGEADVRGVVLSKDLWDGGRHYKVEDGIRDFRENLDLARKAGLRTADLTLGGDRPLVRPESGKAEDTLPIDSPGCALIIREARAASPERPLLVFVGGPPTTVASAYLEAPEIADRLVVLMSDLGGYNGKDTWAAHLVATKLKLVNFGASPLWWPQRPAAPVMPPERFVSLPNNDLVARLRKLAQNFLDRSRKGDRDDGFADGAVIFLVYRPETWKSVRPMRVTGVFRSEPATSGDADYLDAVEVDFPTMTEEFFRVMADPASYRIDP